MDFQISKIILWPKNPKHTVRTVLFERGRINVISGLSRTGKSAIIPIIDYCLASRRCTIPTGVIRDKTSWFGVVISTAEGEKLFARREPEQQQATDDMYLQESTQVVIPSSVTKNTTKDSVKQRLDSLSMLTSLGFTADDAGGDGLGRPSFRDLASFNFQPQNIVANPNVLFYKADIIMPPVAAFPMHYYPAARCDPILPFNSKGLDCQIQPTSEKTLSVVGAEMKFLNAEIKVWILGKTAKQVWPFA